MCSSHNNSEVNKEDLDKFFKEADDEELKSLVSISDRKSTFSYEDLKKDSDLQDIKPKIWGKCIEIGVIEPQGNRSYKLKNRSKISEYLSGNRNIKNAKNKNSESEDNQESEIPDIDLSKADWSRRYKISLLIGIIAMTGFSVSLVQNIILYTVGLPFNFINNIAPLFITVLVVSIFTGLWSTIVRERVVDVDVSEFREYIDKIGGEDGGMFSMPDDVTEQEEQKILAAQRSMMKAQIKPFALTISVTIPLIVWVSVATSFSDVGTITYPILGEQTWSGQIIGPIRTWIVWYGVCTAIISQFSRKIIRW